jgi:hypothetical protein
VLATCILGSSWLFIHAAVLGSNKNIKNWLTKESRHYICHQSCTPIASIHCINAMAFAHGPMRFVLRKTADLHTHTYKRMCAGVFGAGNYLQVGGWVYTPCMHMQSHRLSVANKEMISHPHCCSHVRQVRFGLCHVAFLV